jgi:hypothetical protein
MNSIASQWVSNQMSVNNQAPPTNLG